MYLKELIQIQQKLKAPKGQYNAFGKYKYRSAEDILEAVKPILGEFDCQLFLTDSIEQIGERFYVQSTAILTNSSGEKVAVNGLAREDLERKGMDGAQVTGSASSYARKYALNGLFLIDDTKDVDALATQQNSELEEKAIQEARSCKTQSELEAVWLRYGNEHPEICQNGSKLYNTVARGFAYFAQKNGTKNS